MRLPTRLLFALLALAGGLAPAFAQSWPDRALRIVYPFPPGGSDGAVRLYAERLSAALGQPVLVENKGGAGGNIGAEMVAKSPPDGYTLLMGTNGTLAINSSLYQDMKYDPAVDFAPISEFVSAPQVLFVNPSVPVATVADIVALAKAKPGTLTYASVGQGSASHLTMELFKSIAGVDIVHVPYKGAGPAITDVLGARVSMMTVIAGSAMPHVKAGKVKAIAITSAKASPLVPGVPTMAASGIVGLEAEAWLALVAPAGTPRDVIARLSAETQKILADPAMKERLEGLGFEAAYTTPEGLAALMKRERDVWGKVIKATGARVE